jgi:hypothetical protein
VLHLPHLVLPQGLLHQLQLLFLPLGKALHLLLLVFPPHIWEHHFHLLFFFHLNKTFHLLCRRLRLHVQLQWWHQVDPKCQPLLRLGTLLWTPATTTTL